MIVRDTGFRWQVVAQPDHGDVCGTLAQGWGNEQFATSSGHDSVTIAARRHDDGWALWERTPNVAADGRPLNVFDIGVEVHLAFFRAMIVAVSEEDRYAGLLASMHAVGIYTHRYDTDPALSMTRAAAEQRLVDQFVEERKADHRRVQAEINVSDEQLWLDYLRVQVFDRLCLYFCLNDLVAGETAAINPAPIDAAGAEARLEVTPVAPWEIAVAPYPFRTDPFRVELPRRLVPHQTWRSRHEFAAAYARTPVERTPITIHRGH